MNLFCLRLNMSLIPNIQSFAQLVRKIHQRLFDELKEQIGLEIRYAEHDHNDFEFAKYFEISGRNDELYSDRMQQIQAKTVLATAS